MIIFLLKVILKFYPSLSQGQSQHLLLPSLKFTKACESLKESFYFIFYATIDMIKIRSTQIILIMHFLLSKANAFASFWKWKKGDENYLMEDTYLTCDYKVIAILILSLHRGTGFWSKWKANYISVQTFKVTFLVQSCWKILSARPWKLCSLIMETSLCTN